MAREIRFRTEGAFLVLQLQELTENEDFGYRRKTAVWRDAKVEDLLSLKTAFTSAEEFTHLREQVDALAQFVHRPQEQA